MARYGYWIEKTDTGSINSFLKSGRALGARRPVTRGRACAALTVVCRLLLSLWQSGKENFLQLSFFFCVQKQSECLVNLESALSPTPTPCPPSYLSNRTLKLRPQGFLFFFLKWFPLRQNMHHSWHEIQYFGSENVVLWWNFPKVKTIFFPSIELQSGELNAQAISDLNTRENWGSVDQDLTFTIPSWVIFIILKLPLLLSQFELALHTKIPMKFDKIWR